jgi:hypothetical protein
MPSAHARMGTWPGTTPAARTELPLVCGEELQVKAEGAR